MPSQEPLLRIIPEYLSDDVLFRHVYPAMTRTYYWSDLWESGFYVALARAGFISVCAEFPDAGFLLLPQIHDRCAVLDWKDRRVPKSLRGPLSPGRLAREGLSLRVTQDIEAVLEGLDASWGGESWLHPPYKKLMRNLAESGSASGARPGSDLSLFAVELHARDCDKPVAGELGYVIGATWTSLSGFMHPDRRRWNNMGKVQLHCLGALLESAGFAFWNLGQCQMQYKLDLGARILDRSDFLSRWLSERDRDPPRLFFGLKDRIIPCAELMRSE